jgi:hypothetical protein
MKARCARGRPYGPLRSQKTSLRYAKKRALAALATRLYLRYAQAGNARCARGKDNAHLPRKMSCNARHCKMDPPRIHRSKRRRKIINEIEILDPSHRSISLYTDRSPEDKSVSWGLKQRREILVAYLQSYSDRLRGYQ